MNCASVARAAVETERAESSVDDGLDENHTDVE